MKNIEIVQKRFGSVELAGEETSISIRCSCFPVYDKEKAMKEAEICTEKVNIPEGTVLFLDYPFSVTVKVILSECNSLSELVGEICEAYKIIYEFEDDTSKKEAMPLREENPGCRLINRNRTDGKFGIWGHDIGDLVIERVHFCKNGIYVGIGS